jgi:ribosome-associated protein
MLRITSNLAIDEAELHFDFVTSSGPGGQNVNKVASAAQLRFDAAASPALDDALRQRLSLLAGRRMTRDGVIVIHAQRFRSQEQNRRDATERLVALLRQAALRPKARHKTKPSRAARARRLDEKRRRGAQKAGRKPGSGSEC